MAAGHPSGEKPSRGITVAQHPLCHQMCQRLARRGLGRARWACAWLRLAGARSLPSHATEPIAPAKPLQCDAQPQDAPGDAADGVVGGVCGPLCVWAIIRLTCAGEQFLHTSLHNLGAAYNA